MITGKEILYAILLIVALLGAARAGKMIGMQISDNLFSRKEFIFWAPWILGVGCLAFGAWCAFQLIIP